MSKVETDVFYFKSDVGKNLYRKRTYYTLVVEQDVLANDKDEADQKFLDHGGINHSKITKDLTDTNEGVETYMTDANYVESDDTKFIGKIKYDTDTYNQTLEEAVEAEDIHIDTWADENEPHQLTKIKLVDTDKEEGYLTKEMKDEIDSKIEEIKYGEKLVEPMTKEEEDKNAGVTRDSNNNVSGDEYGV